MKSKQVVFFTLKEDIEQLICSIESKYDIQYHKTGLMDNKNIPLYKSISDISEFGYVSFGDWNKIDSYLVMQKGTVLNIRKVSQRIGGEKYAVDQMLNPDSIEIKIGGIYKNVDKVVVAGRVATISDSKISNELYKLYTTMIKKEFKKIGTFYVGKNAEEKLKLGWRLVTNEKSPKEYDLAW